LNYLITVIKLSEHFKKFTPFPPPWLAYADFYSGQGEPDLERGGVRPYGR
jgi:hypothetical protein